ncbi:MAG: DUF3127 domain-containing protein [Capnocytophaga sp.]|nr:DUF3127 domain-containing protein [Capnocytophaga sp.]
MEIQGRIKLIGATQTFGANGFQKREVVITTEDQYPQHIMLEFVQDRCSLPDSYRLGQLVKISFDLRGREWINPQGEAKYFNTLNAWRIENMEAAQPQATTPPPPAQQPFAPAPNTAHPSTDAEDDLPF